MNLNVVRTLTMRSKVEGAAESVADLDKVARSHMSVTEAVANVERQHTIAMRAQQDFARVSQQVAAANDNMAKSWRTAGRDLDTFKEGFIGAGLGAGRFEREINKLGLQDAVVTGMLKKTKEGFTIIQNPAQNAAGAVGQVTTNLNVLTSAADPASQSVSNFSKHLTLLGAAGVVAGALIAIRSAMDDLFKTANRAQDTRLGSTELLALQAAATSARVPLSDLNSAIDKFTEVSKKAPEDAKEFYKSLSNINPALSEAFKSAPTQGERLRILADGFKQSTNEVQKYQLALQTIGTDNDRTISIFDKGRTALDGYIERARQFGIVVDDAFIAKSQEAQANLNTLFELIKQRLTVAVVEGTLAVTDYAKSWGDVSTDVVPKAVGSFDSIKGAIRDVSYDLGLIAMAWKEFRTQINNPNPQTNDLNKILDPLKKIFSSGDIDRVFAVGGKEAWDSFIKAFDDAATSGSGRTVNAFDQALRNVPAPKSAFQARPDLKEATNDFDRLAKSMARSAAVQEAEAKAVNASVGEHARLRAEMRLQEAAMQDIEKNGGKLEDYAERIKKIADRFGIAAQKAAELRLQSDIKFTGDTLFLSDTEQHIASILRHVHGSGWKDMMKSPEADAMRLNAALKDVKQSATGFAQDFVRGMMSGKSAMDSLTNAAKQLSLSLANSAITNLMSGNFVGAAIAGIGAIAAHFVGQSGPDREAQQAAEQAQQASYVRINTFTDRLNVALRDMDTFVGQRATLITQQFREMVEEQGKAHAQTALLQQVHNAELADLDKQWADKRLADAQHAEEDKAAKLAEIAQRAADKQKEIAQQVADAIAKAAEVAAKAAEKVRDAQGRRGDYRDRVFNVVNDMDTLEGQIAAAMRRFGQEIRDERIAGGESMVDLVIAQNYELLQIQQDFADQQAEIAIRARDEQLRIQTGQARSILEYLNSLQTGPNSPSSPRARMNAAQATYDSQLGLAQGGNADALGRITQDAETLRTAAQAFFGSSAGYQNVFNQIQAQLLSLPVVGTTTDPQLVELRNVVAAVGIANSSIVQTGSNTYGAVVATIHKVGDVTTAVGGVTGAVGGVTGAVGGVTGAVGGVTGAVGTVHTDLSAAGTTGVIGMLTSTNSALNQINILLGRDGTGIHQILADMRSRLFTLWDFNNNSVRTYLYQIAMNTSRTASNTNLLLPSAIRATSPGNPTSGAGGLLVQLDPVITAAFVSAIKTATNPGVIPTFAEGGLAQPFSSFIYGEHHPQGPFFGRTGSQPLAITPSMPSFAGNDNSAAASEIRELRKEIAALHRTTGSLLTRIVDYEQQNIVATKENTQNRSEESDKTRQNDSFIARKTGTR